MAEAKKTEARWSRTLDKLEWPLLLDILAGYCHTEDGRDRALALGPGLDRAQIVARWEVVDPLKVLARQSYRAPVGLLSPLAPVFRMAKLGQILSGPDLRGISSLLESVRKVHGFATDFQAKCTTLRHFRSRLYPMPSLLQAINKAVGPDGELNDDASEQLTQIRRQKLATRKRVEETLRKLLHDSELEKYLQDDFFTVRSERYVVPMRIDGRGRVKGAILDTSDSGQTLFIEPAAIQPINDQLLELDLEEKLEIVRIFRELSAKVESDAEVLKTNYDELIELDVASAEAQLAAEIDGGVIELVDEPTLDLKDARHPLVKRPGGKPPIGNTIALEPSQKALIISGPNAGGKTVVLKTVGLLHLMAKSGLLIPADPRSKLHLFKHVYLEMGDAQNLSAALSTFSGHLMGLKPILEHAGAADLVLLDELAVGTDPQTGAAMGTAVLEDLADRRATVLVTTHFDALKILAINDKRFRNGSMEFSLDSLLPTYRLILDVPGQSYGIEVAEHLGLPARIVTRAKELRHGNVSDLDKAVNALMIARDEARNMAAAAQKERLEAEAERTRWQQETELLKESRRKVSQQLTDKYESKIIELRAEFDDHAKKMRQAMKDAGADTARDAGLESRKGADKALREMEGVVTELTQQSYNVDSKLPGQPVQKTGLSPGTPVFVLPLKKAGTVTKVGTGADDPVEVEVGIIKLRVSTHDLRVLSPGEAAGAASGNTNKKAQQANLGRGKPSFPPRQSAPRSEEIGLVLQSQINSIDLRGKDADDAIAASWDFIDRALLRGEPNVILIHGHGTGTLMAAIRDALKNNCPYDVRWRIGQDQEGGNGVTVVQLKT